VARATGALGPMTAVGGGGGGAGGSDDAWRGSSIAELRRKALEHTVAMTTDSVYR